jgi:hypothetical protein
VRGEFEEHARDRIDHDVFLHNIELQDSIELDDRGSERGEDVCVDAGDDRGSVLHLG